MKHILKIALTLAAVIFCTATFAARDNKRELKGSGNIIAKEVTISNDYSVILATTSVEVIMTEDEGNTAKIEADDNVMEWVVCEVRGDILEVSIRKPNCNSYSNLNVRVTIPKNEKLQRIESRSAAEVHIKPTLKGGDKLFLRTISSANIVVNRAEKKNIAIDASSSGSVQGAFKADICIMNVYSAADVFASLLTNKASLHASSSGRIKLSGNAATLSCEASSAGDILCSELISNVAAASSSSSAKITLNCNGSLSAQASSSGDIISTNSSAERATASASSGGTVKLNCSGTLNAKASSGGDIRYTGSCTLTNVQTSSGGSIKKF